MIAALIVLAVHLPCFVWLRFSRLGPLERLLRGTMDLLSGPPVSSRR